ncbi:MAG: hypothetical protein R3B47_21455 [Bacteroidia bacterium]
MWHAPKYLYTPTGWRTDLAVEFDESGMLTDMGALPAGEMAVEYDGCLVPGFVNAHCHLELSGLEGKVPEGTGMAGFVSTLLKARAELSDAEAQKAAETAMDEAWEKAARWYRRYLQWRHCWKPKRQGHICLPIVLSNCSVWMNASRSSS